MYTKMITSFINILIVINFVHGIYNGISIPNPSNKMIKFPWMIRIAIFFDLDENGSPLINDFFGGTLITSTHILTVAQCSRCLAIHIARPLKNGGALPIFHANPSYFDDSEIQSSNFQ